MLLFIFVPILLQIRQKNGLPETSESRVRSSFNTAKVGRTRVSGLNFELPRDLDCSEDLSDRSFGNHISFGGGVVDPLMGPQSHSHTDHLNGQINDGSYRSHVHSSSLQMVEEIGEEDDDVVPLPAAVTTEECPQTPGSDDVDEAPAIPKTNSEVAVNVPDCSHDNDPNITPEIALNLSKSSDDQSLHSY